MSNRVVQPYEESDGMAGQSKHPYQSVWMARWLQTSCKSVPQVHSRLSLQYEINVGDNDTKQHLLLGELKRAPNFESAKESKQVPVGRAVNIVNETLKTSSKSLRNERSDYQSFPIFNLLRNREPISALDSGNDLATTSRRQVRSQINLNSGYDTVASGDCLLQSGGASLNHVRSEKFLEKSFAFSKSFQDDFDDFVGSTSSILPHGFSGGKAPIGSLGCRQEEVSQSSSLIASRGCFINANPGHLEREHCNYHSYSAVLVREKKIGDRQNLGKSGKSLIRENNIGGQIFGEATVSPKSEGNKFREFLSVSPDLNFCDHQGVKLQPLGSSAECRGADSKEGNAGDTKNIEAAVNLRNESSAETDTMDMDAFQDKNHLSGVASSSSDKGFMGNQNTTSSQATVDSAREEIGDITPNKDILDINQEVPAIPGATSRMDEGEPSISRTQSLDVEHLISQTEQHTDSKSSPCPDGAQEPELTSIWVKRLKLSAVDSFGHGTKSSKIEDVSSHEKANKFSNKIMKRTRTDSEPSMGKRCGKEPMTQDQTPMFPSKDESASTVLIKKDRERTLSHSWIQRWCHNQFVMPKKKPQAMVICEPQSSKAALNEYQMEQYPSIAAMALMGKAMSGFHRCEFRKRGSSVVWNTEGF